MSDKQIMNDEDINHFSSQKYKDLFKIFDKLLEKRTKEIEQQNKKKFTINNKQLDLFSKQCIKQNPYVLKV